MVVKKVTKKPEPKLAQQPFHAAPPISKDDAAQLLNDELNKQQAKKMVAVEGSPYLLDALLLSPMLSGDLMKGMKSSMKSQSIQAMSADDGVALDTKTLGLAVSMAVKEALAGILPLLANPPALVKLASKQAGAVVTIKHADGVIQTLEEPVGAAQMFTSPPCNVGVSSKLTIPLAAYSNAQVSVSLNVPCAHGEIDQVYDYASKWVNDRMAALQKQVNQAKGLSS